ncbi:hypothetical protein CXG81DRAFT_25350 [Caulochytrium protostelioides]|uniref:Complex 1 LYR protein domain-containing protein n=1 Tax=Caulochytrium protostelioides TaxID=1555241 RepID=A0A4P9X9K3_9FUNG|nr:hypothetical protein CXG81DRAFT_25350 [Caulochytrium protostelioides]|eukprot:RKP01998.1 hypothetical protein CXG81DRAFT_25350 [Caulochytrium protostelioides]
MSVPSRESKLALFRALQRASYGFASYNFRQYALRRTADAFRANAHLADDAAVAAAYQRGTADLAMLRRQARINAEFAPPGYTSVIESTPSSSSSSSSSSSA